MENNPISIEFNLFQSFFLCVYFPYFAHDEQLNNKRGWIYYKNARICFFLTFQ